MIDIRYLLSLPNIPKTFLSNITSNNKYKLFQKEGCFRSNLCFQEKTLKEIESSAYKRLFSVNSIKDFRIHKTIKLEKNEIEIIKNSSVWDNIIHIAGAGLKRTPFLDMATMNYLDSPKNNFSYQSQSWHHDNKGNQVKCIILLTDVPENGQVTTYITKSQNVLRLKYDKKSRLTEKDLDNFLKKGNKKNLYGERGSCYFIHTNGIHRGNCIKNAKERIVITLNFVSRFSKNINS